MNDTRAWHTCAKLRKCKGLFNLLLSECLQEELSQAESHSRLHFAYAILMFKQNDEIASTLLIAFCAGS